MKFSYACVLLLSLVALVVTSGVTLDTAEELSILQIDDQTFNIDNDYDAGANTPELPTDACFTGTINPLWYHIAAVDARRTFTVSTCETSVDTVVGLYLADGTLVACNDDRTSSATACDGEVDTCNTLSSSVEAVIASNVDFYIVVAGLSPSATGAIDLRVQSQVEIEDLIEESTSSIITSLTQQLAALLANLTGQLVSLGENINNLGNTFTSAINTLSGNIDGQFSTITTTLGSLQTDVNGNIEDSTTTLSGQISDLAASLAATPDSLIGLTTDVETISTNVNGLVSDTASLVGSVATLQTAVQGVTDDLGDLSGDVSDLDSDVALVSADVGSLTSLVVILQTSLDTDISGVNGNVDDLAADVSSGFDDVTSSLTALNGVAGSILQGVSDGNTVENNLYSFIESAYFENFLLSGTTAIDFIPWKWRTPAAANGSMDDILTYLVNAYNSKLAACQGNTSTNCNTFRQTASPAFSTFVSNYNSQVSLLKYKKAFQVLQSFYIKLFPTALFV